MADRQSMEHFVITSLADILKVDKATLTLQTNLLNDLNAKSVTYFPLISAIEDEYDLEIQYQDFRRECPTIESIVEFIDNEVN